jgi:hypothetical protein
MGKKIVLSLLIFVFLGYSTPTWMWVGTHAINNYFGNGGVIEENMSWSIINANAFWNAAATYSPLAYRYINRTDAEVTHANVSNNSTREMLDFFYFCGHGGTDGLFLGGGQAYGAVAYNQLTFGTNYTRWIYANACYFLNFEIGDPAAISQMMRGAQVALGFAGLYVGANWTANEESEFWENWTDGNMGIWPAWGQAVVDNSYAVAHHNAEITVVNGNSYPPNYIDYCYHSYNEASSDRARDGYSYAITIYCSNW